MGERKAFQREMKSEIQKDNEANKDTIVVTLKSVYKGKG